MGLNNLDFVRRTVDRLQFYDLEIWVAGGWAEELRGMRRPGPHEDLDVFVLAQDFNGVEGAMSRTPEWVEIERKRFSHKRAWNSDEIMVECILVAPDLSTSVFDGRVVVKWPANIFTQEPLQVAGIPVISEAALVLCRERYPEMEQARRDWGAAQHAF